MLGSRPMYLYVLSTPHGGSTLFGYSLATHPQVASAGEVIFLPKLLALNERCTCGVPLCECRQWAKVFSHLAASTGVDMRARPYGFYLGDAIKAGAGLVDRRRQTLLRVLLSKARAAADVATFKAAKDGQEPFVPPYVRRAVDNTFVFYDALLSAWNKSVCVDASKFIRKGIRLYLARPEQVRFVHLIRDARGVVNSRASYMQIRDAALRWRKYHTLASGYLRRWVAPEHVLTLKYEDFVAAPSPTVARVLEWAGVPDAAESPLDFEKVQHSAGGNPARFDMRQGVRGVDEKWRAQLSNEDRNLLESIVGPLNRVYGYE